MLPAGMRNSDPDLFSLARICFCLARRLPSIVTHRRAIFLFSSVPMHILGHLRKEKKIKTCIGKKKATFVVHTLIALNIALV